MREPDGQEIDLTGLLQVRQRIAQQRLVPGRVPGDPVVGKPQGVPLRRRQVLEHDHRHLGDAERLCRLEAAMPSDQHVVLVHQQRVGEPEGEHAGLDLLDLLGRVQSGIAGVRAQFPHRTQHDLRGHPWEGHRGYPDLERVVLRGEKARPEEAEFREPVGGYYAPRTKIETWR